MFQREWRGLPMDATVERHGFWQPALTVALGLLILAAAASYYFGSASEGESAILRWQGRIIELFQGVDVYERYNYPNTPIVSLMLWPIAALPSTAAAMTLFAIKVGMALLASMWAVDLAMAGRRNPVPLWALLLIGLLAARPLISDLGHGNINILVLFLVMGGLRLFAKDRSLASGAVIGLATAVKVTPGLFIPYFAWKREWRAVIGCAIGGLLSVLLPMLVLGPVTCIQMHWAWFDQMIMPFLTESTTKYTYHINQSVPGFLYRWLTDSPGVHLGDEAGTHPVNVLSLSTETVSWIVRIALLGILGWLGWVCRPPAGERGSWRWACEFSLVLIAMLMLSERTWKHHYVTIVLPLSVVVLYMAGERPGTQVRRWLGAALTLFFVLIVGMSGDIIGWIYRGVAHKYVEAAGNFLWAGVILFVAISALLIRGRPPAEPDGWKAVEAQADTARPAAGSDPE
jgi:hypothetical protein